jgi:hypothetical protein
MQGAASSSTIMAREDGSKPFDQRRWRYVKLEA